MEMQLFTSRVDREVWETYGEMRPEILTGLCETFS